MMMGDNSPRSKDSRGWDIERSSSLGPRSNRRVAGRSPATLLTGKAFYVYWPHGKPFGPDIRLSRDFRDPVPALRRTDEVDPLEPSARSAGRRSATPIRPG